VGVIALIAAGFAISLASSGRCAIFAADEVIRELASAKDADDGPSHVPSLASVSA